MKLEDFKIGDTFYASAGFLWRCTDKGTRTITAIMLDYDKEDYWFVGPPYSVKEVVFDDHAMRRCYCSTMNMIEDRVENMQVSVHPGFSIDDVVIMHKDRRVNYPRETLLDRDRVGKDGSILHPYSAVKAEGEWYIKTFELFTKEYAQMHENDFVQLPFSSEEAMRARKNKLNHI